MHAQVRADVLITGARLEEAVRIFTDLVLTDMEEVCGGGRAVSCTCMHRLPACPPVACLPNPPPSSLFSLPRLAA